MKKNPIERISYSGSNTLQACPRKFYHEKVKKTDTDPDYSDNSRALRIGKGFHEVLEYCSHGEKPMTKLMIQKAFENNEIDMPTDQGLILGMVMRYIPLHKKSGLKCVGIETKIGNDDYLGYVDATMVDANGNFWITDLKTAAKLSGSLLSRLAQDTQLNVYSHFAEQIAEKHNLDIKKFAGVRYRVTTKATIKCNKNETLEQFSRRVYDRVESYDIGIPAKDLDPAKAYRHLMTLLGKAKAMHTQNESDIPQNYNSCEDWFRPCKFWSNCHAGNTFTAAGDKYKIYDSTNIPHLVMAAPEETNDLTDILKDL